MKIYIINNTFRYETENIVRVFFPNEKIEVISVDEINKNTVVFETPFLCTELSDNGNIKVSVCFEDYIKELSDIVDSCENTEEYTAEQERKTAVCIYRLLTEYTGIIPPWGILTGVRPIKLFRKLLNQYGLDDVKAYFKDKLLVSEEKIALCQETEYNESHIICQSSPNSYSLYISIPFCPTRCSYCSFVSQSTEKSAKLIDPYVDLLCQELIYTSKLLSAYPLKLETVYIGGGTPTTLHAEQLDKLLTVVNQYFPIEQCREFTVEAGRPDTVNVDKLKVMLNHGVDRISINPQTMNDDILRIIGRQHTAQQTIDAFHLARNIGFKHINMDLITGLPEESFESFCHTLDSITALSPESITVHTLSMKRSSHLTAQRMNIVKEHSAVACKMHGYCRTLLKKKSYSPYYLYRQSRMVGNLENIGYAKKGFEGLYNVYIMDETHSIIACGGGAVTKLKDNRNDTLQRIFNYKYPYEYINGFSEILKRKDELKEFFNHF